REQGAVASLSQAPGSARCHARAPAQRQKQIPRLPVVALGMTTLIAPRNHPERGGRETLRSARTRNADLRVTILVGSSHSFIVRPASAFGGNPVDDLVGIGDVARLAVDTVRGANLQFRRAFVGDHFVDGRGAKILAGIAEFADAAAA